MDTQKSIKMLKEKGIRATPQRIALLHLLENDKTHPSAEEVYDRVKKSYPFISRATVYNNLEIFARKGIIKEITIDDKRRRFDPDIEPHHHFFCEKCEKVYDIPFEEIPLEIPEETKEFLVISYSLELCGVCSKCKKEGAHS
jgi:Fur family peroxide stress response transcriptional regulator